MPPLEAMACGTPVIALPSGAVPEIVKDGIAGYVCRNVEEMAERVKLVGNLDPRQVRSYAEDTFSLERMVCQYVDIYKRVLTGVPVTGEVTIQHRAIA